jgi:MarR family transcriptional regulator, organic hydroperoxide resistance regulator
MRKRGPGSLEFPLEASVGAAIRFTHRAFAQDLQQHLASHEVSVGMWYFLRCLWEEDGLTQRELSRRVGAMEPTTVQQLRSMERSDLITRERSQSDRRKVHVHLTARGKALKSKLLPYARDVNAAALAGLSRSEITELRRLLDRLQANLAARSQARGEVV